MVTTMEMSRGETGRGVYFYYKLSQQNLNEGKCEKLANEREREKGSTEMVFPKFANSAKSITVAFTFWIFQSFPDGNFTKTHLHTAIIQEKGAEGKKPSHSESIWFLSPGTLSQSPPPKTPSSTRPQPLQLQLNVYPVLDKEQQKQKKNTEDSQWHSDKADIAKRPQMSSNDDDASSTCFL